MPTPSPGGLFNLVNPSVDPFDSARVLNDVMTRAEAQLLARPAAGDLDATYAAKGHTHTSGQITDWTEAVQDTVAAMLVSGGTITLGYDDAAGKLTVTGSGTDAEAVRDTIGAALIGANGVSVALNDAADTITLSISGLGISQVVDLQATLDAKVGRGATTDLSTIPGVGIYAMAANSANAPFTAAGTVLDLPSATGAARHQQAISYGKSPEVWQRFLSGTTWSAWLKLSAFNYGDLTDANNAVPGASTIVVASTPNIPDAVAGILSTWAVSTNLLQTYLTYDAVPRLFARRRNGGTWGAWAQIGAASTGSTSVGPRAGMKTVPLAVTVANSASTLTSASGAVRFVRSWPHMPRRVRVRVSNYNFRYAFSPTAADLQVTVYAGVGAADGSVSNVVNAGVITVPGTGQALASAGGATGWVTIPELEDGGYLALTLAWTTADGTTTTAIQQNVGGCWTTTDRTAATSANVTGWTRSNSLAPFAVYVEAEVPARVPVVAVVGDSITCGVGTSDVVGSAWGAEYARRLGALPVIFGASGGTMTTFGASGPGWAMHPGADLSVVDAVVTTLGENDLLESGMTLATLQTRHNTHLDELRKRFPTQLVYLGAITPSDKAPAVEAIRRDFNTWRASLPKGERGVIPWAVPLSAGGLDEDLDPAYYNSDKLHPNEAGVKVMVDVLETRPVTPWTPSAAKLKAVLGTVV